MKVVKEFKVGSVGVGALAAALAEVLVADHRRHHHPRSHDQKVH